MATIVIEVIFDVFALKALHTPRESLVILDTAGGDNLDHDFSRVHHVSDSASA